MKITFLRVTLAAISLLLAVSGVSSKAVLSKLFICGGKLSQPVEVTDSKLLQLSNPWFGAFIQAWDEVHHERTAGPPKTAPRYEISFYSTFSSKEPARIIYVAYYAFDPAAKRGFIYLPGNQEQWYYTNVGSIGRPNQDGRWNLANPFWCDQVNSIISRSERY
jgi:hypothetical protein